MNDSVRNAISSRSSTYAQRGSLVEETAPLGDLHSSQVEPSEQEARTSMASVRSTMPPPPGEASAAANITQVSEEHGTSEASSEPPLAGVNTQAIQKGLEAADKVGVKAAKLGFWGKLAGTVVTGVGLIAFGLITGGAGPLAVAGLALTGTYFLKSCADTHMARLQLQNAKAQAAGKPPPHSLPCGADALAHMMYRPILKRTTKGIDANDTEAMAQATQKAKNWAKGVSLGLDLALGVSSVAVTSAASGKLWEGLAFLAARIYGNSLSSMVASTPPEKYQQESIDLAKRDLAFVKGQLDALRIDEPTSFNDPNAMAAYMDASTQLASLHREFDQIRTRFDQQLAAYERGLSRIDPTKTAGVLNGVSELVGASSDTADMGIAAADHHGDNLAMFASLGLGIVQGGRSLRNLSRQEGLEEKLTQAFLDMNRDLVHLSKQALEFKTVLGMMPLQFESDPGESTASLRLSEPLLTEPLTVPVAPQAS